MKGKELEVLNEFMNMSISSTNEVFKKFSGDKGGKIYDICDHKFYYKPGTRNDRILLIAHADTVWDTRYGRLKKEKAPKNKDYMIEDDESYSSNDLKLGIGADDRAGAAMVYLLKDSGNSILITDEEEVGALTSRMISSLSSLDEANYSEITGGDTNLNILKDIVNNHRFMIQLDMNGFKEFKCYNAGSEDFKAMIEARTGGYKMRPNFSYTDIAFLGKKVCAVNFSIGYYYEHTPEEFLNKSEWLETFEKVKKISKQPHQQFFVEPNFGQKYSIKLHNDNDIKPEKKSYRQLVSHNDLKDLFDEDEFGKEF